METVAGVPYFSCTYNFFLQCHRAHPEKCPDEPSSCLSESSRCNCASVFLFILLCLARQRGAAPAMLPSGQTTKGAPPLSAYNGWRSARVVAAAAAVACALAIAVAVGLGVGLSRTAPGSSAVTSVVLVSLSVPAMSCATMTNGAGDVEPAFLSALVSAAAQGTSARVVAQPYACSGAARRRLSAAAPRALEGWSRRVLVWRRRRHQIPRLHSTTLSASPALTRRARECGRACACVCVCVCVC